MKKLYVILLAAMLLCACAPGAAVSPAFSPAADAPVSAETPLPDTALPQDAADGLHAILTDIAENYHPGTAGCSLTAARLAGALLDWQADYTPAAEAVTAAAKAFLNGLDAAMQPEYPALFDDIAGTAAALNGDTAADLLESAGYAPRHFPYDADAATTLFDALKKGM